MHGLALTFASQGKLLLPHHDAYTVSAADHSLLLNGYLHQLTCLYTNGLASCLELSDLALLSNSSLLAAWLSFQLASTSEALFSIEEVPATSHFSIF